MVIPSTFEGFIGGIQHFARTKELWLKKPLAKRSEVLSSWLESLFASKDQLIQNLIEDGAPSHAAQKEVTAAQLCTSVDLSDLKNWGRPWGTVGVHLQGGSMFYKVMHHTFWALATGNVILLTLPEKPSWLALWQSSLSEVFGDNSPVLLISETTKDVRDLLCSHPSFQYLFVEGSHETLKACSLSNLQGAKTKPIHTDPLERSPVLIGRGVDLGAHVETLKAILFSSHFLNESRGSRVFISEKQWDEHKGSLREIAEGCFKSEYVKDNQQESQDCRFQKGDPSKYVKIGQWENSELFFTEDLTNCSPLQNEIGIGMGTTLTRYKNISEAAKFINNTDYGKRAYVIAQDEEKGRQWGERLNFSQVLVNRECEAPYSGGFIQQGEFAKHGASELAQIYSRPSIR